MTEFITRNYGQNEFEVIVKTDSKEHYKATQDFARKLIDHAKPQTQADRIRAMSDEELADFLAEEKWKCVSYRVCKECSRYIGDCCQTLDEWLKQPAEEDE